MTKARLSSNVILFVGLFLATYGFIAFLKQNLNPSTWFSVAQNTAKETNDSGIEGWVLRDWRANLIDRSFGRSSKEVYQGKASGYLESRLSETHKNGGYFLTQQIDAKQWAGKSLTMASAVKPFFINSNAYVVVSVTKHNGESGGFYFEQVKNTNNWQQVAVTLPVSEMASYISVGFVIDGKGKIYFDNVRLREASRDEAISADFYQLPENQRPYFNLSNEDRQDYRKTIGVGAKATANELQDANFDTLLKSNSPWKIYHKVLDDYGFLHSAEPGPSGTSTIAIEYKQGNSLAVIYQKIDATKFLGKKVRLTGVNRFSGVKNKPGFWLRVEDKNGKALAFYNMADEQIKRNTNWQARSFNLDVLPEAESLVFGVLHEGGGTLSIDSLNLAIVGEIDMNDLELGSYRYNDNKPYPTEVVNPDFEF